MLQSATANMDRCDIVVIGLSSKNGCRRGKDVMPDESQREVVESVFDSPDLHWTMRSLSSGAHSRDPLASPGANRPLPTGERLMAFRG
jgi:hypothetical protein